MDTARRDEALAVSEIVDDGDDSAAVNSAVPRETDPDQRREIAALIEREEGPDGCWLVQPTRRGRLRVSG